MNKILMKNIINIAKIIDIKATPKKVIKSFASSILNNLYKRMYHFHQLLRR